MRTTPENRAAILAEAKRLQSITEIGWLGDDYLLEITKHMLAAFDDVPMARKAVDEFVLGERPPSPGEIWHHARHLKGEPVRKWCAECEGTGWRKSARHSRNLCGPEFADYSAVEPCRCRGSR